MKPAISIVVHGLDIPNNLNLDPIASAVIAEGMNIEHCSPIIIEVDQGLPSVNLPDVWNVDPDPTIKCIRQIQTSLR